MYSLASLFLSPGLLVTVQAGKGAGLAQMGCDFCPQLCCTAGVAALAPSQCSAGSGIHGGLRAAAGTGFQTKYGAPAPRCSPPAGRGPEPLPLWKIMLPALRPTQNADSETLHPAKVQTEVRRATATMNFQSNQKHSSIRHLPIKENRSEPVSLT